MLVLLVLGVVLCGVTWCCVMLCDVTADGQAQHHGTGQLGVDQKDLQEQQHQPEMARATGGVLKLKEKNNGKKGDSGAA